MEDRKNVYVVEREFLSKYSVKELLCRIVKTHLENKQAA